MIRSLFVLLCRRPRRKRLYCSPFRGVTAGDDSPSGCGHRIQLSFYKKLYICFISELFIFILFIVYVYVFCRISRSREALRMNGCDEAGGPREFVSSGLSAEEVHRLTSFRPDGLRLFEYLRDQEAALRLGDFPGHIRSPGLSGELGHCRNFQDTPIRHRGAHMGNFFVRDKERAGASRMRTRNCWWSSPPGRRGAVAKAR